MDQHWTAAMAEATRLTREGQLGEATALIQRTLGNPTGVAGRPPARERAGEKRSAFPSSPRATTTRPPSRPAGRRADPRPMHPPRALRRAARVRPGLADRGVVAPWPGQFVDSSFTNVAGSRTYKLYVPTDYTGQAVPLIVMLHGGSQDVRDFATGTRVNELAERDTFLVAYPEQARSANQGAYWNWFQPGDQVHGAGEPSLIAGITEQVMEAYSVDPERVYVAGFSAGGAMAAVMAATYPELYAAAGIHSGLPYAAAHDIASAFAAMRHGAPTEARSRARGIPLIVFHGDRDPIVDHVNADGLVDDGLAATAASPDGTRAASPASSTTVGQVPGGRAYTRAVYQDPNGETLVEQWIIHEAGHAWSGGSAHGSHTDPGGPDASAELVRFFRDHPRDTRFR
jgi:poly(hydroxyalkanoate) depolymerase family esterase